MARDAGVARLYVDREMSEPELVPFAGGQAAVFSARSPEREGPNQDAAALIPLGPAEGVLAVADGLGGLPDGASASRIAVQSLGRALGGAEGPGGVRGAVLDGIEWANEEVRSRGSGAATTLAAAEIAGAALRAYHVGDSSILVVGQRGRIKLQTVAHSPVGYAVESGLLDEDEAIHHDERHVVSNAIGDAEMRIEVGSTLSLAPRDTVLLATDGLFDNLRIAEIVERIRAGPLRRVARALVAECRERMAAADGQRPCKPDDLTFILFRCGAPRRAERPPSG